MKYDHLNMLSTLIDVIELWTKRPLDEQEIDMLKEILNLTHHDGYKAGSDMMYKIVMDARS
jgi:hypothetical protein